MRYPLIFCIIRIMKAFFDSILAHLDVPTVICTLPDRLILSSNKRLTNTTGKTSKDLMGQSFQKTFPVTVLPNGKTYWQSPKSRFLIKESRIDLNDEQYLFVTFTPDKSSDITDQLEGARFVSELLMHRIRSPLTAMQGFTEMLSDAELEKEAILEGIDQIRALLDDMESFTSITESAKETVDVHSIIKGILNEYPPKTKQRIVLEKNAQFGTVEGNPFIITKIIRELINNALDHSDGDLENILITFLSKGQLQVTNFGNVIPKDIKERIFLPFVTTKARNNGLGLSKVWKWLNSMGGSIQLIQNATSEGITFQITLPLKKD